MIVAREKHAFRTWIFRFWWVLLFFMLSFVGHHQILKKKNRAIYEHHTRLLALQKEKHKKMIENEELLLQIHSQNDPDWMEMVLMKELGVVPKGKLKVHFTNKK